ncbi:MAG: hypothetical protein ABR592_07760 [Nitriliruptorales bacterium]
MEQLVDSSVQPPGRAASTPDAPAPGACFGFSVRSALPFVYLRPGGGVPLQVTESDGTPPPTSEPLISWAPTAARPFHARLFGAGNRYDYWVEGAGWFGIEPHAPRIIAPPTDSPVRREERIWGLPALLCFTARGDVPLHAAALEVNGGAILVVAPGRFGKTTLAGAFIASGHRLLAEDTSCCRITDPPLVLPGPAMLRLRADVYPHVRVPETKIVAEDDVRFHLALDDRARGDSAPVPIHSIVFLRPGGERCELTPADPLRAVPDLWAQSFRLPIQEEEGRRFCRLVDLASRVPLWNLARPRGFERLPEVVERVVAVCGA